MIRSIFFFFFFNDTATTEIYTLSLHDALPISIPELERDRFAERERPAEEVVRVGVLEAEVVQVLAAEVHVQVGQDRKSTRLNSSHSQISYAVFCLKKKTALPTTPHDT